MLRRINNTCRRQTVGTSHTCRILLIAAVCVCLASCAVGPNYRPPETRMPETFATPSAGTEKPSDAFRNLPVIDAARWWQTLGDQELNSLVERAIQANPDIEIALNRLQEVRTQEVVVLGRALPEAGISAGGGRGTGSDLARGRASESLVAAEDIFQLKQITHIAGFDAGWEIDLFGKYRREIEAARYDTEAAIAARNTVLISAIANVTRAYVDMRALQMQVAVLGKNIEVAQQYLDFVQQRFDRGITNELDVTLARRQKATLQAEKTPLISRINAAQYVIAVLLGQFPEDLAGELEKPGIIPQLPEKIQPGLPLNLLRRRPDIREAERNMAGATARIGVATADLFPHLSLTGGAGYQGQGLGVTPVVNNYIWSAGASTGWSLLDFGALDALVQIADLRSRELFISYKQTVLNAVREVDTSLSAYTGQQDRLHNLSEALTANQRAVSLATQRYDRGLTDSLNVIDAEKQEYELEQQYVLAQQTAAEQFIALYKALGGGWEQYQMIPPIRQPQPAILAAFKRLMSPNPSEGADREKAR
ncbi:MAG: efflux transporter outer membrane subunit [Nitrospiria bacterium]